MPSVADLTGAVPPESFFDNNIVMISYNNANRNLGQVWAMWMADGWRASPNHNLGYTGLNKAGTGALPVVSVMNHGTPVGNTFNAYWCPYQSNDLQQVHLSNGANFMFTAKMDGCTFGVGSAAGNGDRIVCHVNLGGRGKEQADRLRDATSPLHGDAHLLYLGPAGYRFKTGTSSTQATTFGVRDTGTGAWKIFSQVCEFNMTARTIRLVSVMRVA